MRQSSTWDVRFHTYLLYFSLLLNDEFLLLLRRIYNSKVRYGRTHQLQRKTSSVILYPYETNK